MSKQIVIVGGGIAGLATAFRLKELSDGNNIDLKITIIEARSNFKYSFAVCFSSVHGNVRGIGLIFGFR